MANRQRGFGMSAELAKKKDAKFDAALTGDVVIWMSLVLQDGNPESNEGLADILDAEGVRLLIHYHFHSSYFFYCIFYLYSSNLFYFFFV